MEESVAGCGGGRATVGSKGCDAVGKAQHRNECEARTREGAERGLESCGSWLPEGGVLAAKVGRVHSLGRLVGSVGSVGFVGLEASVVYRFSRFRPSLTTFAPKLPGSFRVQPRNGQANLVGLP